MGILAEYLNPVVVGQIPATARMVASDPGPNSEAWLWTYLKAVLATAIGYDEAREVVKILQFPERR